MKNKKPNTVAKIETSIKPAQSYSLEKTREIILEISRLPEELDVLLGELGEKILPHLMDVTTEEQAEIRERFINIHAVTLAGLEVETQYYLMASFDDKLRGMAKELTSKIIKEYSCNTHVEKMLAEAIVNGFVRHLDNSRRFNNELGCKIINDNRTKYLAMLSKQIDRSHRQYINSLITLKQLKTPAIEMNIKANTAFIAQNQQNNANPSTL